MTNFCALNSGLKEFDAIKTSEVSDFRVRMKHLCKSLAKKRDAQVSNNFHSYL